MHNGLYYFMLLVIVFSLQACDESFLDESNPNGINTDIYWSNLDESSSNLTSVYNAMLHSEIFDHRYEWVRTDLSHPGTRDNPIQGYRPFYWHQITSDNSVVQNRWEAKYRVIYRANQVIEGLSGMTESLKSQPAWTVQMAQARFFRGLMHFYLYNEFNEGEIIIRDKNPVETSDFSKTLSSAADVISFVREDLLYAYENLPAKYTDSSDKARVTAGTAATILGTSYLYEADYEAAITYFEDVINNTAYGYQLLQDPTVLFTDAGDFNSESIFEINYTDRDIDSNSDIEGLSHRITRYYAPSSKHQVTKASFGGQAHVLPSAWLTYEYSNEPMDTKDPRNFVDGDINGTMKPLPLRLKTMIAVVNDEESLFYQYTAPQSFGFSKRPSIFKKYINHEDANETEVGLSGFKSDKNYVINRLGGVYLMYAECLAKTGKIAEALTQINEVRKRWGLQLIGPAVDPSHDYDGIAYDETSLMEHLMYKEYPLELSNEGFCTRTIDLRRWEIGHKRFDELSKETWSLDTYVFTDVDGDTANRKNALLIKGDSGSNDFVEYEVAASANPNAETYKQKSYLPIPINESLYNPNTNN